MPRPSRRLRTSALERVAERGHERARPAAAPASGLSAERLHRDDGEERGQDAEVAVGQVDDAHDAEDEREPGGEERVEAAEQQRPARSCRARPPLSPVPEVGGGDPRARRGPPGRPSSETAPLRKQYTRWASGSTWLTSCSTTSVVVPSAATVRRTLVEAAGPRRGARPSEISSTRSSRGLAMSPRPMASICCSPPERFVPGWRRRSAEHAGRARRRARASSGPAGAR